VALRALRFKGQVLVPRDVFSDCLFCHDFDQCQVGTLCQFASIWCKINGYDSL